MARPKKGLTYAASGVDTARQREAIRALTSQVRFQRQGVGAPLGGLSHFAGLVALNRTQALAICTDGVGTKLEVARALGRWDTVGIDCVAMNVNDCICVGAEPLAFVDYVAASEPDPDVARAIGAGLSKGAELANVTLAGGETAILPGLVNGLDLAGTCVGLVDKKRIMDGSKVAKGDVLVGLASSGLHSNGYTLARRILKDTGLELTDRFPRGLYPGRTIGDVLLEPTHIYVRPVLELLNRVEVHGLANITGGGLRNVPRINPRWRYTLDESVRVPPVFEALRAWGGVEAGEMYRTFNMGMGFLVVVPESEAAEAVQRLKSFQARVVGRVEAGSGAVLKQQGLEFDSKT